MRNKINKLTKTNVVVDAANVTTKVAAALTI